MIDLNVPGPVPSFLEVYEMVRARLREEGMPDANFTIQDRHGRIVGLQEVQQGGNFQVIPGSNIHSNPAMPYEFTDFYTPVVDQRGNNFPDLLPDNITPSMVNDMIEQYGLFDAVSNLISALNTPRVSANGRTTAASIALMRSRLVDPSDAGPGTVRNNPVDRIASPAQVIAGKEEIFSAEVDRRLKEYFAEEGYSIYPMTETHGDGSPANPFRTTYSMSNNDQFFDNHRLPSRYQTSEELFFRFCHTVLSPYLVAEASAAQFIKHLQQEVVPSLQRDIADNASRASRASREREISQQVRYMLERVATDPKDFYYGREMALMVHPVFLVPHMRYVILPAADQERNAFQHSRRFRGLRSNRGTYIPRAERLLREGGSPPAYVNGARVLPDYSDAEGGGSFVVYPLHQQFAIGPGTTPFSWQFIGDRLRNFDIPGLLRALFTVQEQRDFAGQTPHNAEIYVEAARRLFAMSRAAREDMYVRNAQNAVNNRQFSITRPAGAARYRQTGEMMRPPQLGPYSAQELDARQPGTSKRNYSVNDLRNILTNMGGTLPAGAAANQRAPLIQAIIDYQNNNNISPLAPLDYDRALITVVTSTPILYEIDLPGIHPLPIGWPEPMVFSMMEMLAKYKDHITGLNGSSYDPNEFLSPKINSHFRIDDEAEIDITYYDTSIGRNRRFALSYDQIREVAECDPQGIDMSTTAEYAMRMNALFAQLQGLDNDAEQQEGLERLQRIMSSMAVFKTNADRTKVSNDYTNVADTDFAINSGHDFEVIEALFPTLIGSDIFTNSKNQFFPDNNNGKYTAGGADVPAGLLTAHRATVIKQMANLFLPDFLRVAQQNGTAMFKLDVDVSDGLSSLFILREIVKHAKSAYNYTASDDDITFTYLLMVWCLENCLGQGQQREEQQTLEGFVGRIFNTVFNRNEERNAQIAAELMGLIQAGNIDPAVEEALIEWILNEMGA